MTYPYLSYAVTEAYCMVFAATIWYRLNYSIGTEHEVKQLRYMIYSYYGMLVTDILWALTQDKIIQPPHLLSGFINSVADLSIVCGCYFWFRFIEDRLHFITTKKKLLDTLIVLPAIAVCLLDLLSAFTGWMFSVDAEGHYDETSLFWIQSCVDYTYILVPTVASLICAAKAHSKQDRAEYRTYALYMFVPVVSSLLEDVFPYVPLLAVNIFMMILILFLMIQNLQIYNDALTSLNNRSRLNRHLESALPRATPGHPLLLFIMDINSFKSINDVFGHLEGDRALKFFAGVLKNVASKYDSFIARYGGDEFCLATDVEVPPEEIEAEIQNMLASAQVRRGVGPTKYTMTVSVGYAVCDGSEHDPNIIIARADHMLYDNKQLWHQRNA